MASRQLTLMAVHAHPDDEATGTGGVLARYAAEGIRTVLVTCTDGRCGDAPGGLKPGEPGHDVPALIALRRTELEKSCSILNVSDLETLDYADSGMDGWPQNNEPGSFWSTPVAEAAERLADLMRQYRPDVVVTYDAFGFYGHPDHIQAHRITMAAVELTGIPAKVYWTTMPRSAMEKFGAMMEELGEGAPGDEPAASSDAGDNEAANGKAGSSEAADSPADAQPAEVQPSDGRPVDPEPDMSKIGLPDDEIHTWVDAREFGRQKYEALASHASQNDHAVFIGLGVERFTELMGVETFTRVHDSTNSPLKETDLFTGLR